LVSTVVTLYRLTDVPDIVSELGHADETALIRRLGEIIAMFNPDDAYWYKNPTACIGTCSFGKKRKLVCIKSHVYSC